MVCAVNENSVKEPSYIGDGSYILTPHGEVPLWALRSHQCKDHPLTVWTGVRWSNNFLFHPIVGEYKAVSNVFSSGRGLVSTYSLGVFVRQPAPFVVSYVQTVYKPHIPPYEVKKGDWQTIHEDFDDREACSLYGDYSVMSWGPYERQPSTVVVEEATRLEAGGKMWFPTSLGADISLWVNGVIIRVNDKLPKYKRKWVIE